MRRDASFLKDILTAAAKIQSIVSGTSEEAFLGDDVLQAVVLHHLTVIGEAVTDLDWRTCRNCVGKSRRSRLKLGSRLR